MNERIILSIVIAVVAYGVLLGWRWWLRRRAHKLRREPVPEVLQSLNLPPLPTILYFTTSSCSQCKYQQTPILQRLETEWGDALNIIKLDATEHDELARHFGILTVPTTVVLDRTSQVTAMNHGLAGDKQLQAQIRSILIQPSAADANTMLALQQS